ncbi:MAG TPA: hypothetical protein VKA63_00160 [Candidatus Krumholzibacteria bacterium]|nr:hypothetical protein [Candidatus Krumholzibacteria bacterium]
MSCNYEFNPNSDTIQVTTTGAAEIEELVEMVRTIAKLCGEYPSANILVDHSSLNAGPVTMDEVRTLSGVTVSFKGIMGSRKCAHVVKDDLQYGLVRAWEMMVEVNGYPELETRAFRQLEDAISWTASKQ